MLRLLVLLTAIVWLHDPAPFRTGEPGLRTESYLTLADAATASAAEQQIAPDNPYDNQTAALRVRRPSPALRPVPAFTACAVAAPLPAWRIGTTRKPSGWASTPQRRALLCIYRI